MVVPFGPGTTTNIVARHVAEGIAGIPGPPLVVDNKPAPAAPSAATSSPMRRAMAAGR
jgi:tripartite-type tricarboxylate transporter receptor subunit TctC